ncbi:MAG: DNA polymerase IV [Pseudomonadota bacterium]
MASPALCRDCDWTGSAAPRCPACGSRRVAAHPELGALSVAHLDCDAFYAAIEKRDDPSLSDKPVIVGGGRRGVVATCCYVARLYGVRSAMPMFKALERCPNAVVVKPRMSEYVAASRQIRERMEALTPLVEPLSLDEAFLDLSGTEALHGRTPAASMARLAREIERDVGVSASVGLAPNKFLAKIASEIDKPRGFAVIGLSEAEAFLEDKPVSIVWGVGAKLGEALRRDGFETVGDLRRAAPEDLFRRYGAIGGRLARLARAEDARLVSPRSETKSVSSETTFDRDISDPEMLESALWRLCERVSARMKAGGHLGRTVVLKLKTADFRNRTRQARRESPTQLAIELFRSAAPLLLRETRNKEPFRLIGVGASQIERIQGDANTIGTQLGLLDQQTAREADVERAVDALRARFGDAAISRGRGLK